MAVGVVGINFRLDLRGTLRNPRLQVFSPTVRNTEHLMRQGCRYGSVDAVSDETEGKKTRSSSEKVRNVICFKR